MPPIDDETPDTDETETDDTSEEEDTEESDSDDTEGEEEEEATEEETSDEEEEDSESKPKQYLDLKKLPAELQEAGKRMLATHTKAMQAIPKLVEQKVAEAEQELQVKYSSAIIKAKGFDQLTNLPQFKKFWNDMENGKPYGYSSDFRKNGKVANTDDDFSAESKTGKGVDIDELTERLLPQMQKLVEQAVQPLRDDKNKSAWEQAEKNLPGFSKHRAAITAKLAEHPTLTLTEAYELVAGRDRVGDEVRNELKKAEERARKIPKKSLKPGSVGTKPLTKDTIKSIDDALAHARKDMIGASGR